MRAFLVEVSGLGILLKIVCCQLCVAKLGVFVCQEVSELLE